MDEILKLFFASCCCRKFGEHGEALCCMDMKRQHQMNMTRLTSSSLLVHGMHHGFQLFPFPGWRVLFYMAGGSLMAMGFHPVAGHFISEHYMFKKGFETYSYYGPLNMVTFNVGYHNEHHDFPYIAGSKLPQLRKIAPEYYESLAQCRSWTGALWAFVMRRDITATSRVKRAV